MTCRPCTLACLVVVLVACQPSTPAAPAAAPAPDPTAATPAPPPGPTSRPEDEVKASMDRFMQARTFHAVMNMQGARAMTNEMDFVAPDRYRMKMQTGTQVIIGDTMYLQVDGRTTRVPLPKGTLSQWRDPLKLAEHKDGLVVQALSNENIDGVAARKYLVRNDSPQAGEFTMWISADGLPLQLQQQGQSQGSPYTMTLRYSRFDDPSITISAPR